MHQFPALLDRKSGTVTVHQDAVEFIPDARTEGRVLKIALSELEVRTAGENRSFFFLSRKGQPSDSISVEDPALITALSRYGYKEAVNILNHASRRWRKRKLLIGGFLATVAVLLFGLPVLISKLPGNWVSRLVSQETESHLGRILISSVQWTVENEGPSQDKLKALVRFLQDKNPELAALQIYVKLNRTSEVNAYALPGGMLFVNSGLILEAQSIEEILGILGHELGHIQERHVLKNIGGNLGLTAGGLLIGLTISPDAMNWIFRGNSIVSLKHSRDHEREADEKGFEYLKRASVSPHGTVQFLDRMQSRELSGKGGTLLSLFSSHPISEERLQAQKDRVIENSYDAKAKIPVTLEELQMAVRGLEIKP